MEIGSSYWTTWYNRITRTLSSTSFFYAVVTLAVFQGLWYALSVRPGMYDEGTNLGYIFFYTQHISPFISHQPYRYDYLGDITRNGSYLFYYLMSFPARLTELFTSNQAVTIITLRLIMIATFAVGLYVYRKVFLAIRTPKSVIHIGLLIVILTPMLAPEPGVVNYDIPTFLLTALLLLLAVQIIQSAQLSLTKLILLAIIGLAGIEVKFEFIAVVAPTLLFVAYHQLRQHGAHVRQLLSREVTRIPRGTMIALAIALTISLGLFVERPVYNLVRYHGLNGVSCTKVMSLQRCLQDPIEKRNLEAQEHKPTGFHPLNPITYLSTTWLPTMTGTLIIVLAGAPVFFVPAIFYYTLIYGGIVTILIYLRRLVRDNSNRLLLLISLIYASGLALYNYQSYASLGAAYAMNGRYLLPVLPIFVVFTLIALRSMVASKYPKEALASLLVGC
jgi:hypothetical protein